LRDVAERLRHLLAVDLDEAVVHPVPGEPLALGHGLGPLVLVVREGEVLPPPWMSKPSPSRSRLITTHSVCQPGRPGPQGESQVGSPGLAFFQRTKSTGLRFSSLPSTRAPARSESSDWRASSP
jgi:hypothetical protein